MGLHDGTQAFSPFVVMVKSPPMMVSKVFQMFNQYIIVEVMVLGKYESQKVEISVTTIHLNPRSPQRRRNE